MGQKSSTPQTTYGARLRQQRDRTRELFDQAVEKAYERIIHELIRGDKKFSIRMHIERDIISLDRYKSCLISRFQKEGINLDTLTVNNCGIGLELTVNNWSFSQYSKLYSETFVSSLFDRLINICEVEVKETLETSSVTVSFEVEIPTVIQTELTRRFLQQEISAYWKVMEEGDKSGWNLTLKW